MEFDCFSVDMRALGLLPEKITNAWHTVIKGERGDDEVVVFIYDARGGGIDNIVSDDVGAVAAEQIHGPAQQIGAFGEGMDCHSSFDIVQSHCRQETGEPQKVIAMEVRDENVTYFGERQPESAHLQLCSLGTVHEHKLIAVAHSLGAGIVAGRRGGGAAAEYGYVEV